MSSNERPNPGERYFDFIRRIEAEKATRETAASRLQQAQVEAERLQFLHSEATRSEPQRFAGELAHEVVGVTRLEELSAYFQKLGEGTLVEVTVRVVLPQIVANATL